ncbi:TIGR02679 family protein [Actinokineospora sp.]|uniref:TIGR02679 family protein n=1 Tax=Actinokineospora sp. TaxID=1872133 RepID=UPI003D6A809E
MTDVDRLRRLLGKPELAWLLTRLRKRIESGQPLTGSVTLVNADPEQRRAVELLLGRRAGQGTSISVSLDDLDRMLRTSGAAPSVADAVRAVVGDIPDRVAQESADQAAWAAALAPADDLVRRRAVLALWRDWLASTGMVRRLKPDPADAADLVTHAVRVIDDLPAPGVALGVLAARHTNEAHALDDGSPLATLVLAAARVLDGKPPSGTGTAAERRAAWAAVGVHRDELSSTVLSLALPGGGDSPTARVLGLARDAGEPCVLTLRQLGRDPVLGVGARRVWVCENPIVVATAADELGADCPPLVCLNGQPSTAVIRLLELLARDGAAFAYHGDFDWGGVHIANRLAQHFPWRPWRFDVRAYNDALTRVAGKALAGRQAVAVWDADLSPRMAEAGRQIQEELLLPDLITDLARSTRT